MKAKKSYFLHARTCCIVAFLAVAGCQPEVPVLPDGGAEPGCGDGIVDPGEVCDDGNNASGDGCSADCQSDESCGNGIIDTDAGEACDDGNVMDGDGCQSTCVLPSCGDGIVDSGEACDDGNVSDGDGCSADCQFEIGMLVAGYHDTCALLDGGAVRCWGRGLYGQLGYGNTDTIGDDEEPSSVGYVDVGGTVIQIAIGGGHTCALLDGGAVRCWGYGLYGQLGHLNTDNIGDDETPASIEEVHVGGPVIQLVAGRYHTCALLEGGAVRCWGYGSDGRLGYGNENNIGDDETPASAGDVEVGGTVVQLAAGGEHTCALLEGGTVRCWGYGDGRLGYGNTDTIGDNETPASAGDVDVGGTVVQLAAGASYTCALLEGGTVRCWGYGGRGRLGYGNENYIGDDEVPASAGDVDVGGRVVQLAVGGSHTCVLLDSGAVRCWGYGGYGQLGYRNTYTIGDDEVPASVGDVNVGGTVVQLTAGARYTCALLDSGAARCWGWGEYGQLGYGNTDNIGDDEYPASAGDVPYL